MSISNLLSKNKNIAGAIRRIIVCPVIRNKEDEYLICKMPDNRGCYPGQWAIPGGGIEDNEKIIDAIKREIVEELGDKLIISEIIPLMFKDTFRTKIYADGSKKKVYMICLLFDCLAENTIVKLNDEFVSYAWVKKDDLKNYDLNEATKDTFIYKGFIN